MLEIFDEIQNKSYNEQIVLINNAFKTYPLLSKLLYIYINDQDNIITPMKIMKMMRYYRVEKSNNINSLGEIGVFAITRIELLKRREFGWKQVINHIEIEIKDISFLIDYYNKLKIDITHKNQYKLMKNCFLLLKRNDIKWFVRLLCRKIEVTKALKEVVKSAKI